MQYIEITDESGPEIMAQALAGASVKQAIKECVDLACRRRQDVRLKHNRVTYLAPSKAPQEAVKETSCEQDSPDAQGGGGIKELEEMMEREQKELSRLEKAMAKAKESNKDIFALLKLELARERTLGGWRVLAELTGRIGDRYVLADANKLEREQLPKG